MIKDDTVVKIAFLPRYKPVINKPSSLLTETSKQLQQYFNDPTFNFSFPHKLIATNFQTKVIKSLLKISLGKTLTYGDLASKHNTSARAIGNACRYNPLPILYPCHRIIAKNSLGGFSGKTKGELMNIKKYLLQHEGFL